MKMRMERFKYRLGGPAPQCWDTNCQVRPRWSIDGDHFCEVHAIREMRYILTAEPAIREVAA